MGPASRTKSASCGRCGMAEYTAGATALPVEAAPLGHALWRCVLRRSSYKGSGSAYVRCPRMYVVVGIWTSGAPPAWSWCGFASTTFWTEYDGRFFKVTTP